MPISTLEQDKTQQFIDVIGHARRTGKEVTINWNNIPEGIDANRIRDALFDKIDPEVVKTNRKNLENAIKEGRETTFNYSLVKTLPEVVPGKKVEAGTPLGRVKFQPEKYKLREFVSAVEDIGKQAGIPVREIAQTVAPAIPLAGPVVNYLFPEEQPKTLAGQLQRIFEKTAAVASTPFTVGIKLASKATEIYGAKPESTENTLNYALNIVNILPTAVGTAINAVIDNKDVANAFWKSLKEGKTTGQLLQELPIDEETWGKLGVTIASNVIDLGGMVALTGMPGAIRSNIATRINKYKPIVAGRIITSEEMAAKTPEYTTEAVKNLQLKAEKSIEQVKAERWQQIVNKQRERLGLPPAEGYAEGPGFTMKPTPKEVPPVSTKVEAGVKSITAEDFELHPELMKDLQKGIIAFKIGDNIISAKIGQKIKGQEIFNHTDLGLVKNIDFDKAIPGFLDKQGNFVEQYPTKPVKKPYEGLKPGTQEWKTIWKKYPELQKEMVEYGKLLVKKPTGKIIIETQEKKVAPTWNDLPKNIQETLKGNKIIGSSELFNNMPENVRINLAEQLGVKIKTIKVKTKVPIKETEPIVPVPTEVIPLTEQVIKKPINSLPDNIAGFMRDEANSMISELAEGQNPILEAGEGPKKWIPSTNPEWYQSLGRTKEDVSNALNKIITGEKDSGVLIESLKNIINDRLLHEVTPDLARGPNTEFRKALGLKPTDAEIEYMERLVDSVKKYYPEDIEMYENAQNELQNLRRERGEPFVAESLTPEKSVILPSGEKFTTNDVKKLVISGQLDEPAFIRKQRGEPFIAESIVPERNIEIREDIPKVKNPTKSDFEAQKVITDYVKEKIGKEPKPDKRKSVGDWLSDIHTKLFDRMNPVIRLEKGLLKILPGEKLDYLVSRQRGSEGIARQKIYWKTFTFNPDGTMKVTGEGLKPILDRANVPMEDLSALILSQRDIELSNRVGETAVIGVTPEKSNLVMKALEHKYGTKQYQRLLQVAQEVRNWQRRAVLDPLYQAGFIDVAVYNKIIQDNQYYVPMMRIMEELERNGYVPASRVGTINNPIKKIRGSERQIHDIFESMMIQVYKTTDLINRKMIVDRIYDLQYLSPELAQQIYKVDRPVIPIGKVTHKVEIDPVMRKQLTDFATNLGADVKTQLRMRARRLGEFRNELFQDTPPEVITRFGASEKTLTHEIGHLIDDKYNLQDLLVLDPITNAELRLIADRRLPEDATNSYRKYVRKSEEKVAEFVNVFLNHKDIAMELAPRAVTKFELFLKSKPELTKFSDIKPSGVVELAQMDELLFRPGFFTPEPDVLMTIKSGKREFFKVPHEVYEAINSMDVISADWLGKIMKGAATWLRWGATTSPDFIIRNPLRDIGTAMVTFAKGMFSPLDFIRGTFAVYGRTELYQRFVASGAAHSTLVSLDRNTSAVMLKEMLKTTPNWKQYADPIKSLRKLAEYGELSTRIGIFRKAMAKGLTETEAMHLARRSTIDYARMGSAIKQVNNIIAFFNPNMQGAELLYQTFKKNPMSATLKAVAGITIPSLILHTIFKDDPRYKNLPQWQRDFFWIIPIPGGPILRIPKPFTLGIAFGSLPVRVWEWIEQKDPNGIKKVGQALLDSTVPGYIPTFLNPIIETVTGHNMFTGQPVVPPSVQKLLPKYQYGQYTSETMKQIGNALNWSPAKIENVWLGITAGMGGYALNLSDVVLSAFGVPKIGAEERPTKQIADYPIIKALTAREPIGSQSEPVNRLYSEYERIMKIDNSIDNAIKKRHLEEARELRQKYPEYKSRDMLDKTIKMIATWRKERNRIFESDKYPADEKRNKINKIDTRITDLAIKMLEKIK